MGSEQRIFIGTDSGATTSKIAAVWENGEAVSTKLLQRPTNAQNGRDAVIAGWIAGMGEFLAQNRLQWPQVRGVGSGDSRAVSAVRRAGQIAEPAGGLQRLGCAQRLQRGADPASRATGETDHEQRRPLRRRGRGADCTRRPQAVSADADARLRPGQRVCGRKWPAAHRSDADRHGNRPHGRAAASVRPRRPAVPMRLREKLGLRGSLYRHLRSAASAGGKIEKISRPRARPIHRRR